MNQRKLCFLSLAFLAGTAAAEYEMPLLWCILLLYGFLWMYFVYQSYQKSIKTCFWIAVFVILTALGSFNSYAQRSFRNAYVSKLYDGEECLIQGEIYQKKKEDNNCCLYLKNCMLQLDQTNYSCNQVLLYLNAEEYSIGEILCVNGNIQTFSLPVNEGNYNERAYYQSLKIDFQVIGSKVIAVCGKKHILKETLYQIRETIKENFQNAMPEEDAGILAAMTLGDKTIMDPERKKRYQDAGISHFYSISGLHISLLGMTFYHFLRKRGLGYLGTGGIAAALMLGYGELIGFGISASRAIGMFLFLVYAKYRGRSYDRATSLALMAAILVWDNSGLLHHAGYLLSFGAVFGVILAEMLITNRNVLQEERKEAALRHRMICRISDGVKETFLVSLCIQFVTIPVMCQFFYSISVYSVFINLFVLPCVGVLLGIGIFGGILCSLSPFAGKLSLFLCHLILLLFDTICSWFLKLPNADWITGALPVWGVIFWYLLLFVGLKQIKSKKKSSKLFLTIWFLLFFILLYEPQKHEFEVDILDVGQGDGIYIAAKDGTQMFLDGGSSDVAKVGTYRILPFLKYKGVRNIDYWFVSHCDADHISGLHEIIESDYKIKYLVVSKHIPKDQAWETLQESAEKRGISILKMDRGDAIKSKGHSWSIECLAPGKSKGESDRNKTSLVLSFEHENFTAFFGGDIGEEQELKLVREENLQKVDLYKVSHHGSASASSQAFLNRIQPDMAVISCSMKNRYGHPAKETIERLYAAGSRIYETRQIGQIKIRDVPLEAEGFAVLK